MGQNTILLNGKMVRGDVVSVLQDGLLIAA